MFHCAKRNYLCKLNQRDQPKVILKTVKLVNKKKQPIPTLLHDGKMADSDGDKAYIVSQVRLFPYNIYSWTGEGACVLGLLNI